MRWHPKIAAQDAGDVMASIRRRRGEVLSTVVNVVAERRRAALRRVVAVRLSSAVIVVAHGLLRRKALQAFSHTRFSVMLLALLDREAKRVRVGAVRDARVLYTKRYHPYERRRDAARRRCCQPRLREMLLRQRRRFWRSVVDQYTATRWRIV